MPFYNQQKKNFWNLKQFDHFFRALNVATFIWKCSTWVKRTSGVGARNVSTWKTCKHVKKQNVINVKKREKRAFHWKTQNHKKTCLNVINVKKRGTFLGKSLPHARWASQDSQLKSCVLGNGSEKVFHWKEGVVVAIVDGSETGPANTVLHILLRPPWTVNPSYTPSHPVLGHLYLKFNI